MSDDLKVTADESGVVRVFEVALDGAEAEAFEKDSGALAAALGVDTIDPRYADVFPIRRLAGLSLTDYLAEGHGIPPADLDDHAISLNGLEGWVAVVASGAFGPRGQTLTVSPPLRFVTALSEDRPEVSFGDLPSASAEGTAASPAPVGEEPAPKKKAGRNVVLIVLALIILAFLAMEGFR
jgi:hypothetical protein